MALLHPVETNALGSSPAPPARTGTSDPYVQIHVNNQKTDYKTKVVKKSCDPVWNYEEEILLDDCQQIHFVVKDHNLVYVAAPLSHSHPCIGVAKSFLCATHACVCMYLPLPAPHIALDDRHPVQRQSLSFPPLTLAFSWTVCFPSCRSGAETIGQCTLESPLKEVIDMDLWVRALLCFRVSHC